MEEHKDEEVSEHVDAADVSEAAVSESRLLGQAQESAITEVSESCNGLDKVVGVMGSDVSVQQSGDQVSDGSSSKEEGSEREVEKLEVAGSETEVGGSSVVVESKEEKLVEGGEDREEANCPVNDLETTLNDVSTDAGSQEAKSVTGGADCLFTPAGSKEGNSVESTEGTKEANDYAGADNELKTEIEVGSPSVVVGSKEGDLCAAGEVAADDVGVDDKSLQGIGVVDSSPIESSNETQTVVREMVGEGKLVEEDGERGVISMSEGVSSGKVGTSGVEAPDLNAEIRTEITSAAAGSSILGTISMAGDEDLNHRVDGPGINGSESPGGVASERIISSSDGDSTSTEKDEISEKHPNSFGEQMRVVSERKVASIDDEAIACPNIEGMDSDAFNENFCFSVEELQATVEAANGSTENHFDAFADPQSFYQTTQVVVGVEAVSKQDKEHFSSVDTLKVTVRECLDHGVPRDSAKAVLGEMEGEIQAAFVNNGTTLTPDVEDQSEKDDRVARAKQHLGEEKKTDELHSAVEAIHVSSGTDSRIIEGKEHVMSSTRALNPKAAFEMARDNTQQLEVKRTLEKCTTSDLAEIDSSIGEEIVDEEHVDLHVWEEVEVEQGTGAEQCRNTAQESAKWEALMLGSSEKTHQANYQLPPDNEVEFSVSDLVWGKVRSHPWWPGQIFDPSDASEKAMKYYKKDCFLVAYFGDRTFAWNESSLLKPFRSHFSEIEKQSTSEAFENAVDCALEEVSRRFELGLACSCISEDTYDSIKLQVVENTGIRQESSTRAGLDKSTNVDLFKPNKLVEYVKELAKSPAGGADQLQLVIAKSQLLAFYRLKGYYQLPDILFSEELLENADALQFEESVCEDAYPAYVGDGQSSVFQGNLQTQSRSYNKRKHNLKDSFYPRKKERNLHEIMGDTWDTIDDEIGSNGKGHLLSSNGKQKGGDSFADNLSAPEGRKTISFAKVSTPKPSFKIGDCISRVASQMTASPSILKGSSQKPEVGSDGLIGDAPDTSFQQCEDAEMKRTVVPAESLPLEELLSQLQFAARDPLKGYNSFSIIISFFSNFRNSVVIDQHDMVGGKRRKASQSLGSPETFEFEDMSDTYWRDRFIENGSEEQPSRKSRKRDNHFVPVILDKPLGRSISRKRYSNTSYDVAEQKPVGYVDEKAPAEIVMHFPVVESVPSEINLNKMFKSFGPLRESETEVDRDTNRARVVFKRCSDAEVAYSSAPRFSIFGSTLVNYQLNYVISVPFKTQRSAITHEEDDPTLFLEY